MTSPKYDQSRPWVPADIRRQSLIEAGHRCSVAHCEEHTYVELHHINGNREDNRIENVIILCDKHHKMADEGVIDRKALREYKRLNRERLGLDIAYNLPASTRNQYLQRLSKWLAHERRHLEVLHQSSNASTVYIAPYLCFHGEPLTPAVNADAVAQAMHDFVYQHHHCLLLGNGGSGKTITLLGFLEHECRIAQEDDDIPLPVFVSLHRLTSVTTLLDLLQSALGKQGVFVSDEQLVALLAFGRLCVALDGLNEIRRSVTCQGAFEDIQSFLDRYSGSWFILSTRYTLAARNWQLPALEMGFWDHQRIHDYLVGQLGPDLGEAAYIAIGDRLDFKWLSQCSLAGLCSNPLTLWMLAAVTRDRQQPPTEEEEIVDALVDLTIRQAIERHRLSVTSRVLCEALEDVAYLMIARGDVLSTSYENVVEFCATVLQERKDTAQCPSDWDAYQLLFYLLETGLLCWSGHEVIEWLHQVVQERLSVKSSERRFRISTALAQIAQCPNCGYRAGKYFEQDGVLYGECEETDNCCLFKIDLPESVYDDFLAEKIVFVDHTGAPRQAGMINIPTSYMDEHWMAIMPTGILYHLCLSFAQNEENQELRTSKFIEYTSSPDLLVRLEILSLAEAGILRLEQMDGLTRIHVYTPPANPALRFLGYNLITLRPLSCEELEETPDERIGITSADKEKYLEERRRKNLPVYHYHMFVEKDKHRVFRIAQRYGGRVTREWGPYEEIVAEFPGEAWDFGSYALER